MDVMIDGVCYVPRVSADVGGRVKSLSMLFTEGRKHKGMTLAMAAKASGLTPGMVASAEYGQVTLATACILAELYGIPMSQISRAVRRTPAEAAFRKAEK